MGGSEGDTAATAGVAAIIFRNPSLGDSRSAIGRSYVVNGSKTPNHIASCFEILNDAFAYGECASCVPMATFQIAITFRNNRW